MTLGRFACLFSLALFLVVPASAQAGGRVASATGVKQVHGKTLFVDVVVAVPAGQSARQATDRALSEQGARRAKPPWAGGSGGPNGGGGGGGGGEQYFYTGLEWSPPLVTQNYNPAGQPFVGAQTALTNTHSDWSNVSGSTYRIRLGDIVNRCPSLVQQCDGPQAVDGNNDVGWAGLSGTTLGVTWFTTSPNEADMALNTRFTWKNTCGSTGSGVDVETVLLHENGHVAGLDHASRTDSVMYPSYQSPRCTLFDYDRRSIVNLYH
jgi:Matrixin